MTIKNEEMSRIKKSEMKGVGGVTRNIKGEMIITQSRSNTTKEDLAATTESKGRTNEKINNEQTEGE